MSQVEVIRYLKRNGEMSVEELAKNINVSIPSIWHSLSVLLKSSDVKKRALSKEEVEKKGKRYTGRSYVWKLKTNGNQKNIKRNIEN